MNVKVPAKESDMLARHHPTSWIRNVGLVYGPCWMMLGQHFLQKVLDESLKQFKHSSNISLLISRVRYHPTCWTIIHVKKMSISFKFESFNVRMSILLWIDFFCLFVFCFCFVFVFFCFFNVLNFIRFSYT